MPRLQTILSLSIVQGLALLPMASLAASLYNPLGQRSIPQVVGFVIQVVLGISGSIALLMIVWGGFTWLMSQGEPDKIKKGQQTIVWSVIGIAVLFGANILATYIINTLGGVTTSGS
ncbi:MAG: pilin [Patescibacteria group bacterium]